MSTTSVTPIIPTSCGERYELPYQALGRERAGELAHGVAEDPRGQPVEEDEQPDEDDHRVESGGALHAAHDHALDDHAGDEGEEQRGDEGAPVRPAGVDQAGGDEGGEHRQLPLGEVHLVGRLEDHHQRERDAGVDGAAGETGEDLMEERLHVSLKLPGKRGAPLRRR